MNRVVSVECDQCTVTRPAPFEDVHGHWYILPPGDALAEKLSEGLTVRALTIGTQGPFDVPVTEFDRLVQAHVILMGAC